MNGFGVSTRLMPEDLRGGRGRTVEAWFRGDKGEPVTFSDWLRDNQAEKPARFNERVMPLINRFTNAELQAEEVIVGGMMLCNDQPDYYNSQFEISGLEEVVELAPGAPVMRMHNYRSGFAEGVFFDGRVTKRDSEALAAKGVRWADLQYYALNDEEGQRNARRARGGLDREVSIGWRCVGADCTECGDPVFACRHIPGDIYSKGIARFKFSGITGMLEGSHVYRGGQKETTTYIPEGSRSNEMAAVASAVNRFMSAMSGEMEWDAIGAMKREFLVQIDRMPMSIRAAAESYRRAVGFGTLCAEPGERSNTQAVACSRERFTTIEQAKRWARDHDFRVDRRTASDDAWIFEQVKSAQFEKGSLREHTFDKGVMGKIGKPRARQEERTAPEQTKKRTIGDIFGQAASAA